MRNLRIKISWTVLMGLLVAGCTDRPELWSQQQQLLGPHKVADAMIWLEATRGIAIAIDPAADPPRVSQLPVGRNILFGLPSPDKQRLLVLTGGKEALRVDQRPEAPMLTVLEPSADGPRVIQQYELPSAFDRLSMSDDGRWAVAYFGQSSGDKTALLRNPNEVAIFDLEQSPNEDNPSLRTLRSFGSAPLDVVFSPSMTIPPPTEAKGGTARVLAVVLSRNYLTFIDVEQRQRGEITVPLSPTDSSANIVPQQLIFSPEHATVFVRADGTTDLFALTLEAKKGSDKENDFRPVINQPSSGKNVHDMLLLQLDGVPMILTANASNDLSLIDPATSESATIELGEAIDTILAVPAKNPTMVLLYNQSKPEPRVHFLSLEKLALQREGNLRHRSVSKPVHQLVRVPGDEQALVIHNDARDVISLLDLVGEHHTDTPIQGRAQLHSFDFVSSDYLIGVSPNVRSLGVLDLQNHHPRDLRLDHNPQHVTAMEDGTIIVDHGGDAGLITIVPSPTAEREASRVLWGFVLSDLVDLELED